jgi:hypothetical protein
MKLFFTKGIKGSIENEHITLHAGDSYIKTELTYNADNLLKIEIDYRIRFIGMIDDKYDMNNEQSINFCPIYNGHFFNITNLEYNLDEAFSTLYDLLLKCIFHEEDYYKSINNIPSFLLSEGIYPFFFLSKDDFQKGLVESRLMNILPEIAYHKYIYLFELNNMVANVQDFLHSSYQMFLSTHEQNYEIIQKTIKIVNPQDASWEYLSRSKANTNLASSYMAAIHHLVSCLDVITKLLGELTSIPDEIDFSGEKYIRLKCGNIYFSNINRYMSVYKTLSHFTKSFFPKKDFYQDLILTRNELTHNSFLSTGKNVFVGKNTDMVNNKNICYSVTYLWDIYNGKPTRWLNRDKFFSQNRSIDEWLLNYYCHLFIDFYETILLINEYLSKKSL